MKKTIAIVLTLVLCLGLFAGCGKKAEDKVITVAATPTPMRRFWKWRRKFLPRTAGS